MRKIEKGNEPASLQAWRKGNQHGSYIDISNTVRQDIREACVAEQFYLCAYCCQRILGTSDTINEHVKARQFSPNRSLDFENIVASCKTRNQCDSSHGSQSLPLTPLMVECETELRFIINGRVEGLTDRAKETIRILNLGDHERNNKKLVEKRKQLALNLMFEKEIYLENLVDKERLRLVDKELLQLVIDDLNTPREGRLAPFAPVVANILKGVFFSV